MLTNMTSLSKIISLQDNLQNSLINLLPTPIFWKDKNSVYMGCNTAFATALGFKSCLDVIGKTDFQLPVIERESKSYRQDDKQVIITGRSKFNIKESQTLQYKDTTRILLTNKVPLLNEQNEICGVLGISFEMTQQIGGNKLVEQQQKLMCDTNMSAEIEKLSRRQKQCVYYLMKGMSLKKIACILDLSLRTVEHHINAIKIKFGCFSRAQLLEKCMNVNINDLNFRLNKKDTSF